MSILDNTDNWQWDGDILTVTPKPREVRPLDDPTLDGPTVQSRLFDLERRFSHDHGHPARARRALHPSQWQKEV